MLHIYLPLPTGPKKPTTGRFCFILFVDIRFGIHVIYEHGLFMVLRNRWHIMNLTGRFVLNTIIVVVIIIIIFIYQHVLHELSDCHLHRHIISVSNGCGFYRFFNNYSEMYGYIFRLKYNWVGFAIIIFILFSIKEQSFLLTTQSIGYLITFCSTHRQTLNIHTYVGTYSSQKS